MQPPQTWRPFVEAALEMPPALGLIVAAALLWVGARARERWRARAPERALKRRQRIAEQAEYEAAGLLRSRGYHILDAQVEHSWTVRLDGEAVPVVLRADYLVSRGPKRYIAEVKSGRCAPSISTAATRRQLLEYRVAYPVDGILLVDMEAVAIHVVDFGAALRAAPPGSRVKTVAIWGLGVLTGAGGVFLMLTAL